MLTLEQRELDAYHGRITTDVKALVEKYRAIFDWDVPDIDQTLADRLILTAIHKALDELGRQLDAAAK